jgi:crotonobetainyl-CoA:carnitine CoA-transferase CaiB-like acyl-CoA transferase
MSSAGPLQGIRILDLTAVVMGPYATQTLGDLGADIVKVEPPSGDNLRAVGPMRHAGMGAMALHLNRNKRSIVLDLKQPEGREACLRLAAGCDALIYNTRPQAMARLGLGYEAVAAANPKIVYLGAFGYGEEGPYAGKPAYDDLIQGAAGLPALLKQQGAEQPRYAPIIVADRSVGQQVASAVSAALYYREKSGEGQRVDVPMFEHLLQIVLGEHLGGYTFEPQVGEAGYARMLAPDRRPYPTKDGYVCALIYNDKQWRAFFEVIGRPEMFSSPDYATQEARSRNYGRAYAFVAGEMKRRTTAEWLEALERADIPVQRMNSLADIVADPHLAATGFFQTREHPSEGAIRSMAVPSEWSASPPDYRRHAPRLGEHTVEVLREAGVPQTDIEALTKRL